MAASQRAESEVVQRDGAAPAATARRVTDRQLEILTRVARGWTNREIGASLGISERTVRNHMREILKRLASSDRTHAVVIAITNGWIAIPIEPYETPSTAGRRDEPATKV